MYGAEVSRLAQQLTLMFWLCHVCPAEGTLGQRLTAFISFNTSSVCLCEVVLDEVQQSGTCSQISQRLNIETGRNKIPPGTFYKLKHSNV